MIENHSLKIQGKELIMWTYFKLNISSVTLYKDNYEYYVWNSKLKARFDAINA